MCTHFIQPSATPTIERLGLAERIEAAGGIRNGTEVWTRYGWIRPELGGDYRHPRYGYDIRRLKLDPMLRELAVETPGVELMLGQGVTGLVRSNGRPAGVHTVDRERRARDVTARVIVAADGRDSAVARMAGVRARVKPHDRFGYFAYYRDLPLVSGDRTLLWLLDPDIAYAFPQDDGITLMACFQTKDRMSWFKRDVEANFEAYFQGLPGAPDLAKGQRISKVLGKLEMPNTRRPAGRPGLAFVGDAAMAADPAWGVGCGGPSSRANGWARSSRRRSTATRRTHGSTPPSSATANVTGASCSGISWSHPNTPRGAGSIRSSGCCSRQRPRTKRSARAFMLSARGRSGRPTPSTHDSSAARFESTSRVVRLRWPNDRRPLMPTAPRSRPESRAAAWSSTG